MHPDVARERANQCGHEMRAGAGGNASREIRKELRRRTATVAVFVLPRIPDHVDGAARDVEPADWSGRDEDGWSRMNERRARENSAYVRKLLSEREPEFAAALAAAERYISWCLRSGGDEDRDDNPLCGDSGTEKLGQVPRLRFDISFPGVTVDHTANGTVPNTIAAAAATTPATEFTTAQANASTL